MRKEGDESRIRTAKASDRPFILAVLQRMELPHGDLMPSMVSRFSVCIEDGDVVGVIGLEAYDGVGLIRSLAVVPTSQGVDVGAELLATAEAQAQALGLRRVYALTTTAQAYFERRDYRVVRRSHLPTALRASTQVRTVCPKSAVCLAKDLPAVPPPSVLSLDVGRRAVEHFDAGFLCAEAVLLAAAESFGEVEDTIPRLATGFCSGVARTGGQCGALSGAIMAIGLRVGRRSPHEPVNPAYAAVREVLASFETTFGAMSCRALLAYDIGTEAGRAAYAQRGLHTQCQQYVAWAARSAVSATVGTVAPRTDERRHRDR